VKFLLLGTYQVPLMV